MLKFHETPCDVLFRRTFALEEDGVRIGGGALVWRGGAIYVEDFELDPYNPQYADLLAGALLNAACNTDVELVRVPRAPHWARFGLAETADGYEQKLEHIVFDSECKSHKCDGDCAHCANAKEE